MRKVLVTICLLAAGITTCHAEEHWIEVNSPHFRVLTDSSTDQARHIAAQFERMRLIFAAAASGTADDGSPILVVALKDRKDFRALEPVAYLGKGKLDLAGYFMQRQGQDYVLLRLDAEGEHPYSTIYHEYTHYLLRADREWLPLWLNEGLAEFYQNTDISDQEAMLGQPSIDDLYYLQHNQLIPTVTLFQVDANSPYYHEEQKGTIFYAESWALVHYLITTDRERHLHRLEDYEQLLQEHVDPVTAGQRAFGDLSVLDQALEQYTRQLSYAYFRMTIPTKIKESSFQATPVSTADADAVRAGILVDNDRAAEGEALLEATLKTDPNNALAHEMMGYANLRLDHPADAEKWYGEAVQLNPNSFLAEYRYAELAMRLRDKDTNIEASLRRAIALNPRFAPAYDALARFYSMQREKSDEAHMLELQAVELEPDNVYYRLNTANALTVNQQYMSAINVLDAAKHVAKNAAEMALVDDRLQEVQNIQKIMEAARQATGASSFQTPDGSIRQIVPLTNHVSVTSKMGESVVVKTTEAAPNYPMADPNGPKHTVNGLVREVKCYDPAVMTVLLESQRGKTILLYRNNYYKITFTAANFTPKGDLHPCTDLAGLKARVEYAEVDNPSVAGQILTMQLSK